MLGGLLLFALASTANPAIAATQMRVDELVKRCAAKSVLKLRALDAKLVAIEAVTSGRSLSIAEQKQFNCVLDGTKEMRDLQFGFLGNETYKSEKK